MNILKTPLRRAICTMNFCSNIMDANDEPISAEKAIHDLTEFYEMKQIQQKCKHLFRKTLKGYPSMCVKCGAKL